jgi:hypothetical protein
MTLVPIWIFAGFIAANAGLLAWSLLAAWRINRRLRHAQMLDNLLAQLCIQCFFSAHMPIWSAWTAVMGDIQIEVKQNRRTPE